MKEFFGDRLRDLRGKLSQREMANKLGTKQATYSAWERNAREPDLNTVCSIALLFNVTTDWLLGLDREQAQSAAAVAEPSAPSYACPNCAALKAQVDKLLDTLHNLSMGRSHPARTTFSGPVKY